MFQKVATAYPVLVFHFQRPYISCFEFKNCQLANKELTVPTLSSFLIKKNCVPKFDSLTLLLKIASKFCVLIITTN